jgi:Ras-related protein Rab-1A
LNNRIIKLQIWDTAGQERFRTVTTSFYRGAHGILLVYDITNYKSLQNVSHWLDQIKKFGSNSVQVVLVGNKSDLVDQRLVDFQKAKEFADFYNIEYFETSAKSSENVQNVFNRLGDQILGSHVFKIDDNKTKIFEKKTKNKNSNCC